MIVSITTRCNLACAGCYMKHQRVHNAPEMSPDLLRSIVAEAADLGVSIIVIAGGEPLIRKDEILSLARSFPRILFPLFTNGLMIDADIAQEIAAHKNIVPLIKLRRLPARYRFPQGHRSLRPVTVIKHPPAKEWHIFRVFGYGYPCEYFPCDGRGIYP